MAATQIIVPAFIFTAVALAIFGGLRHVQWVHDHSPDPTALIDAPRDYLLDDDSRLLWVLAWLALVTAAAVLLAWVSARRLWLPYSLRRWASPAIPQESSWHSLLEGEWKKGANWHVEVECEFDDGSWVVGSAQKGIHTTDEAPDRELVLRQPLRIGLPGDDDYQDLHREPIHWLVISARDVKRLFVTYYERTSYNVVLTGFTGCEKTTVGESVACKLSFKQGLQWCFVDTDKLIEEKYEPIKDILAKRRGKAKFRKLEREVAADVAGNYYQVIATGGRMLLDSANAKVLTRSGRVFCLATDSGAERADGYSKFEQVQTAGRSPDDKRLCKRLRKFEQVQTAGSSPDAIAEDIIERSGRLVERRSRRYP